MSEKSKRDSILEVMQEIQLVSNEASRILKQSKDRRREQAVSWAGHHWYDIQQSFSAAASHLQHSVPLVRKAALYMMAQCLEHRDEFIEICKKLAYSDPDIAVRVYAIDQLSSLYSSSCDKNIGAFIAQIICDQSRPDEEQKWAYMYLLIVFGRIQEFAPLLYDSSLFPRLVDWEFVDSLL